MQELKYKGIVQVSLKYYVILTSIDSVIFKLTWFEKKCPYRVICVCIAFDTIKKTFIPHLYAF